MEEFSYKPILDFENHFKLPEDMKRKFIKDSSQEIGVLNVSIRYKHKDRFVFKPEAQK